MEQTVQFHFPISVNVEDACRLTGVSRNEIYRAIRLGKLQSSYVRRRRLVLWSSLELYILDQRAGIDPLASDGISYFALHKIFYLLEWESIKKHGGPLTRAYFVRQKDGPYCVNLQIQKLKKALPNLEIIGKGGNLYKSRSASDLFGDGPVDSKLDERTNAVIVDVLARYGSMKDGELKTAVYLTTPMRNILRREELGVNMFNSPIFSQQVEPQSGAPD